MLILFHLFLLSSKDILVRWHSNVDNCPLLCVFVYYSNNWTIALQPLVRKSSAYPSLYTAKSKKVALVTGHSGKWNNAMIYLSEHQTIASQFPMPKATFIESATMRDISVDTLL